METQIVQSYQKCNLIEIGLVFQDNWEDFSDEAEGSDMDAQEEVNGKG